MDRVQEANTSVIISEPSRDEGSERPPVEAYDPHFGRLFERSESFFRRYETTERPEEET